MGEALLRNLGQGAQFGSILGKGKSAQEQAEANAAIDRQDAKILLEESHRRAAEIRQTGRDRAAAQKVKVAGSGFTQAGTLQLQLDEIEAAEFNALEEIRVGNQGASRAKQSAELNVRRGKVARNSSFLDAAGFGIQALGKKQARAETLNQFK
jgi:hypothetical protein